MNNKKSKKLKNKYVTVEDMNKLLDIVLWINLKLEANTAVLKSVQNHPDEINISAKTHMAIKRLQYKINHS